LVASAAIVANAIGQLLIHQSGLY